MWKESGACCWMQNPHQDTDLGASIHIKLQINEKVLGNELSINLILLA
jgi:hypothetical protein